MNVHYIHDKTQEQIIVKLVNTEFMMGEVLKRLNGCLCYVEITALEDLGFSNNLLRMRGGFYTGTAIQWNSNIPFIPVDATVNSCGVSIFQLNEKIPFEDFKERVSLLSNRLSAIGISNNFERGNHFISLCEDSNEQQFLVLHASDNSFKYGIKGLYPRKDTWYYDSIQTMCFESGYIRYLSGDDAERFYQLYQEAEKSNPIRNRIVADILLEGCTGIKEVLYSPHYGMPDMSSVAIGSQWRNQDCVLLSYEGAPIFIVNEKNRQIPFLPHGFGVTVRGECRSFSLSEDEITINDIAFKCNDGFLSCGIANTRNYGCTVDINMVQSFMPTRTITICNELRQRCSVNHKGIASFE